MATIIFNGKSYNSVDEMSANDRAAYEQMMNIFVDANGNGIPDFLEGDVIQNLIRANSTKVNVAGQTYHNFDELPPDLRQRVDEAFQAMTKFGILPGVPVEFQKNLSQGSNEPMAQSRPFGSQEYSPSIQEESGPNILLTILIVVGLFLCLALAGFAVYYFVP